MTHLTVHKCSLMYQTWRVSAPISSWLKHVCSCSSCSSSSCWISWNSISLCSSSSISFSPTQSGAPRLPTKELVTKIGSGRVDIVLPRWGVPACLRLRTKRVVRIDAILENHKISGFTYHRVDFLYPHILENCSNFCYIDWLRWSIPVNESLHCI